MRREPDFLWSQTSVPAFMFFMLLYFFIEKAQGQLSLFKKIRQKGMTFEIHVLQNDKLIAPYHPILAFINHQISPEVSYR